MATGSVVEFEAQRRRLFGLATACSVQPREAQDVVQDAFLRWSSADHATITLPSAWLPRWSPNLCLNRLTSVRARRARYIGPWLPEPVLTADGALGQPFDCAELRESVSFALLVAMERLTSAERAVFVLRQPFGYSYQQITEILAVSEANCPREPAQRAVDDRPHLRGHVGRRRMRVPHHRRVQPHRRLTGRRPHAHRHGPDALETARWQPAPTSTAWWRTPTPDHRSPACATANASLSSSPSRRSGRSVSRSITRWPRRSTGLYKAELIY